jgi:hypothetical protein
VIKAQNSGELGSVFDPDTVRALCRQTVHEKDPVRFHQLLSDLRALIKDEIEDVALRAHYITKKYGPAFRQETEIEENLRAKLRRKAA